MPTNQSICLEYACRVFLPHKSVLVVGPTGTSKTTTVKQVLRRCFEDEDRAYLLVSMSGETTPQHLQRHIEARICARKKKSLFGPDGGKSLCAVFIDELNMPARDQYGSQPTLELLRQGIESRGWYDLDSKEWRGMTGVSFAAAMQDHPISPRLRRQFY